jgi:hypothetical protein
MSSPRHESAAFLGSRDEAGYLSDVLVAHSQCAAAVGDHAHRDSEPAVRLHARPPGSASWRASSPSCSASRHGRIRARSPEDIDKLKRRITELEQTVVDLTRELEERGEELDAARAANREMITRLNISPRTHAQARSMNDLALLRQLVGGVVATLADHYTHRHDEQELSVLCLRVLQAALVYVFSD